jgi:hypothetical protein
MFVDRHLGHVVNPSVGRGVVFEVVKRLACRPLAIKYPCFETVHLEPPFLVVPRVSGVIRDVDLLISMLPAHLKFNIAREQTQDMRFP